MIDLTVGSNLGETRQTTLTIAGQTVPLVQFGGADPIAPDAIVTISNGAECLTSVGTGTLQQALCDPSAPSQQFRLRFSRDLLYAVVSISSGNCLDMTSRRQAGIRLYQHSCNGEDHQLFQFLPQVDGSWQMLGNTSFLCQESRAGHLEQQPCRESAAQRFQISTVMANMGPEVPTDISDP